MKPVKENGLYLPTSLVEELAEERAAQLARQSDPITASAPVWFETGHEGRVPMQSDPGAHTLLNNQKGWAQISLRAIMDRVKSIEWSMGERVFNPITQKWVVEERPEHRGNNLLRRPNPLYSGQLLKMLIAGLVAHTGACYLQKIYDGLGVPVQLWPIPTQVIRPYSVNGMLVGGYEVQTYDGQTVILEQEDVIRVWRPDLKTLYGELGMLGPQAVAYDAQTAMGEQKKAHFERDAIPRSALMAESDAQVPDEDEVKRFNASWRHSYDRRVGTAQGLPAFIPSGFKVHEFNQPSNAQDIGLDERYARQIMAGYGVPQFAVGIDTNVNRATGETTMWAWDQNMVEPMTDLIADAFTHQMTEIDFGEQFVVFFEDFVQPDKEFELRNEQSGLAQKKITINEARAKDDLEPVSWGDLPVGSLADAPYTGEVVETEPGESPGGLGPMDPDQELENDLRAGGPRLVRSVWDAEESWRRNQGIERRNTPRWAREQLKLWQVQRDLTMRRMAKVSGVDLESLEGRGNSAGRRAVRRANTRDLTVDEIFDVGDLESQRLFEEIIAPLRAELYTAGAAFAHNNVGAGVEFFLSPFMERELRELGAINVVNVDTTTRRRIGEELARGQREGESLDQLARRVESVFIDARRARTIARTEIGIANQAGTLAGFRSSGVVEKKVWNTSRDGNVRDSHRIDGQEVTLEDDFTLLDGDRGPAPLAHTFQVENRVNCRCFVTPKIEFGVIDASEPDQSNEG